ncbi:Ig-like domain-containing protein [Halorhabdus rudnickae]|uniref:Ig-like domain-containing protein n=1 Tax=Halorhabdus rudnickae TaxID=1775544 RepID=UPI00108294C1|nr:Ig-like domain-containing protein [Halorhabdus rudnickae]
MAFRDDDRGQAIQIGAVLLFAVLVIAFSLYQAFVVPNQNAQVESNHLQTVEGQLQDLRDGIVNVPKTGNGRSVRVSMGTNYPARAVALNPPPASGQLRTVGTADPAVNFTIANARALDEETADYWNGTNRTRGTGGVVYEPDYNQFQNAPTLVYDSTTLSSQLPDTNFWVSGQTLVDGRTLTFVALDGVLDRSSSRSLTVDIKPISASTTDVPITNESGENVSITFRSHRSAGDWRSLLVEEGQWHNASGGHVVAVDGTSVSDRFDHVTIELERNETYELRMAKSAVGTGATTESETYITDVAGDGAVVSEEGDVPIVVEARDRYNNPVSGVPVRATIESGQSGSLVTPTVRTDDDGRARFTYNSADIDGNSQRSVQIHFTLSDTIEASIDPRTPENVSVSVSVQNTDGSGIGGGGDGGSDAYTVEWTDPSGQSAINCPDGVDSVCTFDPSQQSTASLTMGTSPIAQQASVEYALNDTSVLTLSRTTGLTDSVGENSTGVTALANGFVNVYASSGSSGDRLTLEVVNEFIGLVYNNDAVAVDGPDFGGTPGGVELTIQNDYNQDVIITDVKINETTGPIGRLSDDELPNDQPRTTEVYIETDQIDGWVDVGGGTSLPAQFDLSTDSQDAVVSSGGEFRVYLYEFKNSGDNQVDMSDRAFTLTVFYETADGNAYTKPIRVNVQ